MTKSFTQSEAKGPNKLPPVLNEVKEHPVFDDPKHHIRLYQGDSLQLLALLPESSVDLIFADPPYFLSNGGITCHAGKMVSVNKGAWDKSQGPAANHDFNRSWLAACQRILKPNGSVWVSGTAHIIHSVGFAMQQLGFKLLNDISWVKPNPPPNLSCRYFTHATETIIWAARDKKSRHTFNYKLMKESNRGKQMKSVWEIKPPETWEKRFGKHPTQKPLALLERILLASSHEGDLVLDPFSGSGTTALAALRLRRSAIALELSYEYLALTLQRLTQNLFRVELSFTTLQFSLDLFADPVDRSSVAQNSCRARLPRRAARSAQGGHAQSRTLFDHAPIANPTIVSNQLQLVQTELRFYFIGRHNRSVIFSVQAPTLEDALRQFRNSGHSPSDALFIIKSETQIFLA
jgi:site-specific DNA-methyltransferase (adenine-specific)